MAASSRPASARPGAGASVAGPTAASATGLPAGWRPLPGTPVAPTRLGDSLDRVLRSLGVPTSTRGVEVVFERWAEVVGEAMAARTRPRTISGESLVVSCDDPAVATHVRFLEPQLLARLGELAGERRIARVEVRVERSGGRHRGPWSGGRVR